MKYALISEKDNAVGVEKSKEEVRFDPKIGMLVMADGSIPVTEDGNSLEYINFSL